MQQALYNNIDNHIDLINAINSLQPTSRVKTTQSCKARFLRHLALKWDLYGVVALMVSSTAYGVFALVYAV